MNSSHLLFVDRSESAERTAKLVASQRRANEQMVGLKWLARPLHYNRVCPSTQGMDAPATDSLVRSGCVHVGGRRGVVALPGRDVIAGPRFLLEISRD